MRIKFTFVVVTCNNVNELRNTLRSFGLYAPLHSEIIIIDASDDISTVGDFSDIIQIDQFQIAIIKDDKNGIYNAMNVGVFKASGEYIIQIPAGDLLYEGADKLLSNISRSECGVVVFEQAVADASGKIMYKYTPNHRTLWPHQSVVLKRSIHDAYGLYDTTYKYTADQMFFSKIRKCENVLYHKGLLTTFLLGGYSSKVGLQRSIAIYQLHRDLGSGFFYAVLRSLTPHIRAILNMLSLGNIISNRIKIIFFLGNRNI